ncbi:MAG: class I SAM-dependent methyltransferase [Oceanospirillaceae bacterium]|nr:class I SAM-dependent methyltransferase [Oceanospirillaceae bacterium]
MLSQLNPKLLIAWTRIQLVKTEDFWDAKAHVYAKSVITDEKSYKKKLTQTQALLAPHMRVLEFGCGTGTTAVRHAPYVQHIDAIDISQQMIEIGRRRADKAKVDNITFTRGTLASFNADTASLDAVLGLNIMHLLPDWQSAITEVARTLKPGGVFVSSTGCLGGSYLRLIKLLVPLGKRFGFMPDVFIITESQLAKAIKSSGFVIQTQWHHGVQGINVFIVARKK